MAVGDVARCARCGTEFVLKNTRQRYCCRKCADAAYSAGGVSQRYEKFDITEETAIKRARREIKKAKKVWQPIENELKRGTAYRDIQIEESLMIQRMEMEQRRRKGDRHA